MTSASKVLVLMTSSYANVLQSDIQIEFAIKLAKVFQDDVVCNQYTNYFMNDADQPLLGYSMFNLLLSLYRQIVYLF